MSCKCARVTFYAKCLLRISFPYATIHVETFAHQSKFRKTGLQFMKQLNSTNLVSVSAHTQWFPVAVSSFDWFDQQIYAIPGFGSCHNFWSDTIFYQKVGPAHGRVPSAIIYVTLCHNSGSNPYWGLWKMLLLLCSCVTLMCKNM